VRRLPGASAPDARRRLRGLNVMTIEIETIEFDCNVSASKMCA
jgi:hypothetical protein